MSEEKKAVTYNVNISVEGNNINSPITGVEITNVSISSGERPKQFRRGNVITSVFTEFLGLPSLQELDWRLKMWSAIRKGRAKEYRRIRDLWSDITNEYSWYGVEKIRNFIPLLWNTAIKLYNVQITEFVNRNPGSCYSGYFSSQLATVWEDVLLTPSFGWHELRRIRSATVRRLGLGDIRFTKAESDLYLLNATSLGSAQWADDLDASLTKESGILSKYVSQRDDSKLPLFLGQKLYASTQSLDIHRRDLDQISLGGFPILITARAYNDIADSLHKYGAVALQSIKGMLVSTPQYFPLAHGRGLPRWCLFVGSPKHIQGISLPEPMVCCAWTVTVDDSLNQGPDEKYLQWMFKVGLEDWRYQLQQATEVIDLVRNKIGATAVFEFDEERNWFDPYTPFTPKTMRELFQRIKQGQHKGLQLLVEGTQESS